MIVYRGEDSAYQVDDTGGVCLVLSALGEEEEAFAGLAGPGSGWVSEAELLVLEVSRELFNFDSFIAEPEVALSESEAPLIEPWVSLDILVFCGYWQAA